MGSIDIRHSRRGRQTEKVTTVDVGDGTSHVEIRRYYDGEPTETIHWKVTEDGYHYSTSYEFRAAAGIAVVGKDL